MAHEVPASVASCYARVSGPRRAGSSENCGKASNDFERGRDDASLRRVGDVGIGAGGVRMLADMPKPVAGPVAFEAGELAGGHDLDRPDLRHRDRQQQARRPTTADSACARKRCTMSPATCHSLPTCRAIR